MEETVNVDVLKRGIVRKQHSISESAKNCGLSISTLYRTLHSGKASLRTVAKICSGLDLDYDTLTSRVDFVECP